MYKCSVVSAQGRPRGHRSSLSLSHCRRPHIMAEGTQLPVLHGPEQGFRRKLQEDSFVSIWNCSAMEWAGKEGRKEGEKKRHSLWFPSWLLSVSHPFLWGKPRHEKHYAKFPLSGGNLVSPAAAVWVSLASDPPPQSSLLMTAALAKLGGNLMNLNSQAKIVPETMGNKKCLYFKKREKMPS